MTKINIALAGGPCTGKSVLAAHLWAHLKIEGFDYDFVQEECRKLKKEFGKFKDPFERFYFWRQQEREELRSTAEHGFITDNPLFQYYAQVQQFVSTPRDKLALRELYRMCLEIEEQNRYGLIIMAEDPREIEYKTDMSRSSSLEIAKQRHQIIKSIVDQIWPERLFLVNGDIEQRTQQAIVKIKSLHSQSS